MAINGEETELEVLQFFEFDSDRKRSSIIIRHKGVIKHLMKGADSIILARLDPNRMHEDVRRMRFFLEKFSLQGLRTLCYSVKMYSEEEYAEIAKTMEQHNSSPEKAKLVAEYSSELE